MNKTVELLDRIQELERENTLLSKRNSSLSQTVDELQQQVQQVQNPFYVPPVSFHRSPLDYVASDFWFQPADSLWNQPISQVRRNDPRFKYIDAKYPWLSTDGDFTSGYELFAAEDSPDREEENAELRKKVGELRKTIEKLNKKLETINSPLVHVVKAIKEKARYDSPSAAYEFFVGQDYIYRDCDEWKKSVKELKDFLLCEKAKALLPPPPNSRMVTDEQMAEAISSINGEKQPLNEKQKWMGVCCLVRARYGYPYDFEACCNRLANLPYKKDLYKECDWGNVRKLAGYSFCQEPYDKWHNYCPKKSESKLFDSCFYVARSLEEALEKLQNNAIWEY